MEKVLNPTVCFFDSGIGGLWLLYECVKKLPDVDFIYFSDNAHVPYGSLPKDKLIELTDSVFAQISKLNPKAAVVACNTVTACCIDYIRNKYPFEIIGIQPAVKPAAKACGKCLVLATPSTAASVPLKALIDKFGNGRVVTAACPDLAQYIENNIGNIDEEYIKSLLPKTDCASVVLGCTHYIYIKEIVKSFYNCPVFDGIEGTADNLVKKLGKNDHRAKRAQKITFEGGLVVKNRDIFRGLVSEFGLKCPESRL